MKLISKAFYGLMLFAVLASASQTSSDERKNLAEKAYKDRIAYSKSKDYEPYSTDAKDAVQRSWELIEKKSFKAAIEAADNGLKHSHFSIDLLMAKSAAYHELGDAAKAQEFQAAWIGVADSILSRGDGKSFETAFTVISVDEEYSVLRLLKLVLVQQALVEHDGKSFDRLDLKKGDSDQTLTLFFNVDLPFGWERRQFEGIPKK